MVTIADNIRRLAKEKKVTIGHIHNSLGMSNAGFYKMLRNGSYKQTTINDIAQILEVSPSELLEGTVSAEFAGKLLNTDAIEGFTKEAGYQQMIWTLFAFTSHSKIKNIITKKDSYRSVDDIIKELEKIYSEQQNQIQEEFNRLDKLKPNAKLANFTFSLIKLIESKEEGEQITTKELEDVLKDITNQ